MNRHGHTHCVSTSAAVGMFLVAALAVGCGPENETSQSAVLSEADQAGVDGFTGIEWVQVAAHRGTLAAAVARPTGAGPFPVVVVLHGTHGFAREYVRLAQDLARRGRVVAVAVCWFAGGQGAGRKLVTPIDCPDAPAMSAQWSSEALESVSALVAAARKLPGVRDDRVALVGHSRGAGGALHYVVERGGVRAVVLNSAGYDQMVLDRAAAVGAPLLLLHGTEDGPGDGTGGNGVTAFDNARKFESALREEGKRVEVKYFEGAHHNSLFTDARQYDETVRLVAAFLRQHLAE